MDDFMNWVKQIIYLLIFLTLLMELLPQKSYGKYVRFFAGLVFVVALITPAASLVGSGNWSKQPEQGIRQNLEELETAGGTKDVNLEDLEEIRERMYADFAGQYTED